MTCARRVASYPSCTRLHQVAPTQPLLSHSAYALQCQALTLVVLLPGLLGPVGEAAQQEEKRAKDMTASERFPEFKGAPVADAAGKTVGEVEKNQAFDPRAIKPLGLEVRNVRCVKCKKWGHQMGDDECPMKALSVETE
eukprot:2526465-Rhodomonas_salina.1